ncbi:MAG: hypothetical protein ACR2PH_12610 [Desulfobulbia bacterium]
MVYSFTMSEYSALRSVNNSEIHLVLIDGEFDVLPQHIRHSGPWQGVQRGSLKKLTNPYRQAVDNHGYWLGEVKVRDLMLE